MSGLLFYLPGLRIYYKIVWLKYKGPVSSGLGHILHSIESSLADILLLSNYISPAILSPKKYAVRLTAKSGSIAAL